jgi:hypothetical protein
MAKAGVKRKIGNKAHPGNAKRPNNKNGGPQKQQQNFAAQQFGNPGFISFDQRQQPNQNQKPNGNRNQMANRNGGGMNNMKRQQQWGRNGPNNGPPNDGFHMNMNRPPMPPMSPFHGPMGGPPHPPPPRMFPPRGPGPFPPQRMNGKFNGKPMPMRGPMGPPFMGPGGPPWRPPMRDNLGPQRANMTNRKPMAANKGKGKKRKDPYSLDEPWVTAELREIDTKKKDIQAKLKGVKNDALFEEFRKASALFKEKYDAAKLEHIGKQPPKVNLSIF